MVPDLDSSITCCVTFATAGTTSCPCIFSARGAARLCCCHSSWQSFCPHYQCCYMLCYICHCRYDQLSTYILGQKRGKAVLLPLLTNIIVDFHALCSDRRYDQLSTYIQHVILHDHCLLLVCSVPSLQVPPAVHLHPGPKTGEGCAAAFTAITHSMCHMPCHISCYMLFDVSPQV
jgi:hypothetical protein